MKEYSLVCEVIDMKATAAKHEWSDFLNFYTQKYAGRPTRLGTFETANGTILDYWIEDGLPLAGIDIDTSDDLPTIEIMLGDLTHIVDNAKTMAAHFSLDGIEDGIDIIDSVGKTTILRFEIV